MLNLESNKFQNLFISNTKNFIFPNLLTFLSSFDIVLVVADELLLCVELLIPESCEIRPVSESMENRSAREI